MGKRNKPFYNPMFPEMSDPIQMPLFSDNIFESVTPNSAFRAASGVIDVTDTIVAAARQDFSIIDTAITPEQFELLICKFFKDCGYYVVRPEGGATKKDGGIDIYVCPNISTNLTPFFIGIQVRQKQYGNNIPSSDIRDFDSAIKRSRLANIGMFVTNTSFTPDAVWIADTIQKSEGFAQMRLRDRKDVLRWLHGNYVSHLDWREVPQSIEVAPGIKVKIDNPFYKNIHKQLTLWIASKAA
jgi:hypothetical protein